MKLVIFTTETTHHAYFVKRIAEKFTISETIIEGKNQKTKYHTSHQFEIVRNSLEKKIWFEDKDTMIKNFTNVTYLNDLNDYKSKNHLKNLSPNLIIMFGCGKIDKEIIDLCGNNFFNLHGGDPEYYRGLDSHLWAIWHNDFKRIVVTLHQVEKELDTGKIYLNRPIKIIGKMKLEELRIANTEVCVDISAQLIKSFYEKKNIKLLKQNKIGRYYSYMPSCLKQICREKFERYTNKLIP